MNLTKYETIMKTAGLIYALIFIFTAVVFFLFMPDTLMSMINGCADLVFGKGTFPHYPGGENRFWNIMTISMMSGVTITSLLIWKDVKKYRDMAIPLFTMKFFSSGGGLLFFLLGVAGFGKDWNAFANLVIFITDFPLGLLMLFLYRKVKAGE